MLQRVVDEISRWIPWSPTLPVVLLAVDYDTSDEAELEEFLRDFRSRILLTYRSGFSAPIALVGGQSISSDTGWGCMLRVMQMILAQSFLQVTLGREWRYDKERDLLPGSTYLAVRSCFLDVPDAPFSLHALVSAGQQLLNKEPSAWFGPTSAARAAGYLFEAQPGAERKGPHAFLNQMACEVFEDGVIFKDRVLARFDRGAAAILILVCRRLGLESFNLAEYRRGLEECFRVVAFVGLASGNSASSAHYFVGSHGDSLLYLDPHNTQQAVESVEQIAARPDSNHHPARPLPLSWTRLNPSVCMGFLLRSKEAFAELCHKLAEAPLGDVFEVFETAPCYTERGEAATDDGMTLLE